MRNFKFFAAYTCTEQKQIKMDTSILDIPISRKKICQLLGISRSRFIEAENEHGFKKYYLSKKSRIPHYYLAEIKEHFIEKQ